MVLIRSVREFLNGRFLSGEDPGVSGVIVGIENERPNPVAGRIRIKLLFGILFFGYYV